MKRDAMTKNMIRLEDVSVTVPEGEFNRCYHAICDCYPILLNGHYGYVMSIKPVPYSQFNVLLCHTGPQTCRCKEEGNMFKEVEPHSGGYER